MQQLSCRNTIYSAQNSSDSRGDESVLKTCSYSSGPSLHVPYEKSGSVCRCPSCLYHQYVNFLFSNQRRSSPHVLSAMPSPDYALGQMLPDLPHIPDPKIQGNRCPFYTQYGFCPNSIGCYLEHDSDLEAKLRNITNELKARPSPPFSYPRFPRGASADEELERLRRKAEKHLDNDVWTCDICGFDQITQRNYQCLTQAFYYRKCPQCLSMCFFPEVTYLLEHLLLDALDDASRFKSGVEKYRELVPDEFKIPLSFEAHQLSTKVFAWSLVAPKDIKYAMDAVFRVLPSLSSIVSVGSGVGYVEHLFNRVMNRVDPCACGPVAVWKEMLWQEKECETLGRTSTDERRKSPFLSTISDEKAVFYGKRFVPIYAFDEIERRYEYSVHVSLGGPLSVLSVDCPNSALLLCWPPFGRAEEEQSSMGYEALEYFRQQGGRVLIFIGDEASTGDWRFHELCNSCYRLVREYSVRKELRRWHPQEMGLIYAGNDTIGVYERRY